VGNHIFYSLYGHLCLASMGLWKEGSLVQGGAVIGYLGESHENVGWPPHLHFQLMKSLEGMAGDYPGVCHQSQAEAYFENCPNPLVVFGKPWISKLYGSVGA
jgi:murein DD-endopeptidase MepM/ murein hydrolase activator NlpD